MPKRKPTTETAITEPETTTPRLEDTKLAEDYDFLCDLYRRREIAERKSALALTALEKEYKGLGMGMALSMESAGVKSVDLGDGTILQWISGPGPVTDEMVKGLIADLLRAGVQPDVLRAAVDKLDEARKAATWFSVKFVKAVKEAT